MSEKKKQTKKVTKKAVQATARPSVSIAPKPRPKARPLSPHLQVYRWLITSTLSILHRMTGVALSFGLLLVSCWITTLAYHSEIYNDFSEDMRSPLGLLALAGWSWALFYHLCNGIRHLFWDTGRGFDLKNVTRSGYTVLVSSVVLTALTWATAFGYIKF